MKLSSLRVVLAVALAGCGGSELTVVPDNLVDAGASQTVGDTTAQCAAQAQAVQTAANACQDVRQDPVPASNEQCQSWIALCAGAPTTCPYSPFTMTLGEIAGRCGALCAFVDVGFREGCATTVIGSAGVREGAFDCIRRAILGGRRCITKTDGWLSAATGSCGIK